MYSSANKLQSLYSANIICSWIIFIFNNLIVTQKRLHGYPFGFLAVVFYSPKTIFVIAELLYFYFFNKLKFTYNF